MREAGGEKRLDAREGSQAKECRWFSKGRKGKKMNSLLEPPEEISVANTFILTPLRPMSHFWPPELYE